MDRLRAMELFATVAQNASFTQTGRQFGLSATSVSRAITELEEHLGVPLLLRSTRQVALSAAGRDYARQVDGVLRTIRGIESGVGARDAAPAGPLRVHSRVMFGLQVLTPLIAQFRQHCPDITVELLLGEYAADLQREGVDIDFRIAPPVAAGVKRRMLFLSERYLVAAPRYLEQAPPLTSPAGLVDQACLTYRMRGTAPVWRFRHSETEIEEIRITPRHVSNNGMALLQLARLGEGIALLDDYTVAADLERGTLIRLLPGLRVSNSGFDEGMFVTLPDSPVVPARVRVFLDFVAARVAGSGRRFSFAAIAGG